jgi:signal peptidase I
VAVVVRGPAGLNPVARGAPLRWVATGGAVVVVLFLAGVLPIEAVRVASDSMAPTLRPGDRVLVEHATGQLRPGDLLVLEDPTGSGALVKRLVARGGDRVAIEDGVLVINNVAVGEPYVDHDRVDGMHVGPVTVPAGLLYVLGDNRDDSVDSREFGPVRPESVTGRVTVRLWPSPGRP